MADSSDDDGSVDCLHPDCERTFDSENGMKRHLGQLHEAEELLLDELRRLAGELGRTPTYRDMDKHGAFTGMTYKNRFGSWNDALREAGLETNMECPYSVTDQDLLDELRRLAGELGRTPTHREMNEHGAFDSTTYQNRFGSWNDALREAGLETNRECPYSVTDQDLLDELRRLAGELGRTPTFEEMNKHGAFSAGTYMVRFGSWNNARREVGLEPVRCSPGEGEGYTYGPNYEPQRQAVLERDDHRCRLCGRHADELGQDLHVHHIRPVRLFHDDVGEDEEPDWEAMNAESNLILLCRDHHVRFEGRWQDADPEEFVERAEAELEAEGEPAVVADD